MNGLAHSPRIAYALWWGTPNWNDGDNFSDEYEIFRMRKVEKPEWRDIKNPKKKKGETE